MSEENQIPKPKLIAEIKITFDGQNTQVTGPITNELLCQAMLEQAAQVIRDFNNARKMEAATKSALVSPSGVAPKDLHIA